MSRWSSALAAGAVVLLMTACSEGADPPTSTDAPMTSSTLAATTTPPESTAPSTTTASTVASTSSSVASTLPSSTIVPTTTESPPLETTIQELLDRYDDAVTTILSDPRVTTDPASPAVTEYLALFAPDSTFAQGALNTWAQAAAEGRSYRPGPGGSMINSTLYELDTASDADVSFTACSAISVEVVDAAGSLIEARGGVSFIEATAILIDGHWLFRDLTQSDGDCPGPRTNG
jgi:hypothetical protein